MLEEKLKFITEKIPTRIMNVAGSNAGAGSGEFHMYRQVGILPGQACFFFTAFLVCINCDPQLSCNAGAKS